MNRLFFPKKGGENEPIIISKAKRSARDSLKTPDVSSARITNSIPSNWIYNEAETARVWSEIEAAEPLKAGNVESEAGTFRKIGESATKIRNTISSFEIQDQQFLMELLEFLDDNSAVDTLDESSILFEARSNLSSMIEEHADLAGRQAKLLDSLLKWFSESKKTRPDPTENQSEAPAPSDILLQLSEMKSSKESSAEKAKELHQDMISSLMEKVRQAQQTLVQKELAFSQVMSTTESSPKAKKALPRKASQVHFTKPQLPAINLSSPVSKPQQQTEKSAANMPQTDEEIDKELYLEEKLKAVNEQKNNLQQENKFLQEQILKNRQNELVLEKRLASTERQRQTLEASLSSSGRKLKEMKDAYEEKLSIMATDLAPKDIPKDDVLSTIQKYEKKISELQEQHRQELFEAQQQFEARLNEKLKEFFADTKESELIKSMQQTATQYSNKVREDFQKQLANETERNKHYATELTNHYESLLLRKEADIDKVRRSIDAEVKGRLVDAQISLEEKLDQQLCSIAEKSTNDFSTFRHETEVKIDKLRELLGKVTRERDSLRAIIGEQSQTENDNATSDEADSILKDTIRQLKEREIEARMSEKAQKLLNEQKIIMNEQKEFEISKIKASFKAEFEKTMDEFRKKAAEKGEAVVDCLKLINSETEKPAKFEKAMIPISEVDAKLDEYKAEILELKAQIGIWQSAFQEASSIPSPSFDDVVKTVKVAIDEHTKKIADDAIEEKRSINGMKPSIISENPTWWFGMSGTVEVFGVSDVKVEEVKKRENISLARVQNHIFDMNGTEEFIKKSEASSMCSHCGYELSREHCQKEMIYATLYQCEKCHRRTAIPLEDELSEFSEMDVSPILHSKSKKETVKAEEKTETKQEIGETTIVAETNNQKFNTPKNVEGNNQKVQLDGQKSTEKSGQNLKNKFVAVVDTVQKASAAKDKNGKIVETPEKSNIPKDGEKLNVQSKEQSSKVTQAMAASESQIETIKTRLQRIQKEKKEIESRLEITTRHLSEIEGQYVAKIHQMEGQIHTLKQSCIEESKKLLSVTKTIPQSDPDQALKVILDAAVTVSSTLGELNAPSQELNNGIANLKQITGVEDVNSIITNTEHFLDQIDESLREREVIERSPSEQIAIITGSIGSLKSIRIVKEAATNLREMFLNFVQNSNASMLNFRTRISVFLKGIESVHKATVDKVTELKCEIAEQVKTNENLNKRLQEVQEKFTLSASAFESLSIQKGNIDDQSKILLFHIEDLQKQIQELGSDREKYQQEAYEASKEADRLRVKKIVAGSEMSIRSDVIFSTEDTKKTTKEVVRVSANSRQRPAKVIVPKSSECQKIIPQQMGALSVVSLSPGLDKKLIKDAQVGAQANEKTASERRIRILESLVDEKCNLLEKEREKLQKISQSLYHMGTDFKSVCRRLKREELLRKSSVNRLNQALELIKQRDNQIFELNRIIAATKTEDAELKPTSMSARSIISAIRIGSAKMRAITRWEALRQKYLEEQKNRLLRAMDAMRYTTRSAVSDIKPKPVAREIVIM